MQRKIHFYIFLLTILFPVCLTAQDNCGIIPTPQNISFTNGVFAFNDKCVIEIPEQFANVDNLFAINQLQKSILDEYGYKYELSYNSGNKHGNDNKNKIVISIGNTEDTRKIGGQGYILNITPKQISIISLSDTGLFYGIQSLKQIIKYNKTINQSDYSIPCLNITDYPAIQYRGWMHDISRGPIPTMDLIKQEISTLSEYKLNFFNLYIEQVFILDSHPSIAPTDGISKAEIKELEEYAKKYHVELIGNQQCFAHAEKTLKIPYLIKIKDNAYNVNPGTEETYKFYEDVFAEEAPTYTSHLFNINCDETEGLGSGFAKYYVEKIGVSNAYANHINKINRILNKYDKRVMMWGDIAVTHPEIIPQLPKDVIIIVWSYVPSDNFENLILPFTKTGFDFMIAPGVSCWSQIFPDLYASVRNIANFVRDGHKNGTIGVMNTCWYDSGENFFNNNWYGLLWGSEMSWKPITNTEVKLADNEIAVRKDTFDHLFNIQFFGTNKYNVVDAMFQIDSIRYKGVPNIMYSGSTWKSLTDFYPPELDKAHEATNISVQYDILSAKKNLLNIRKNVTQNTSMIDNAIYACDRAYCVALENIVRIHLYQAYQSSNDNIDKTREEVNMLFDTLSSLRDNYAALWNKEYRSFSRDVVMGRFDNIGNEILNIDKTLYVDISTNSNNHQVIVMHSLYKNNENNIYYTLDGTEPTIYSMHYDKPFVITNSSYLKAKIINGSIEGSTYEKYFICHKGIGRMNKLNCKYSTYNPAYSGGRDDAAIDGIMGSNNNYADGHWQGFQGQDFDIEIDFKNKTDIQSISTRFFNNVHNWIMAPQTVEVYTSSNGKDYKLATTKSITIDYKNDLQKIVEYHINDLNLHTRYLRFVAKNAGKLPSWHQAAGSESYIFIDELIIQ